jgi:alpha-N-acetylglucosamine transferase
MNTSFKDNRLFKILLNKYVITILFFALLLLFSPDNNIIYYNKVKKQYQEIEQKKDFILDEIKQDSIRNADLEKNIKAKEKYGREKYLMKAENEDIYIIKQQGNEIPH